MSSYVAASQEVMSIFEHYDPNYAQMSLDEAYMDITPYCETYNTTADAVVKDLRERVRKETGLTVSVGIAPNKMLAKISSDRNKPNGQFLVKPDRNFIIDFMQGLPCRKIPGIGRVTERILSSLGVNTCGDIWHARTMLHLTLGDLDWLLSAYLGIHSNVVEPAKRGERRSVGREHTFRPTSDPTVLKDLLKQSAEQVQKDLQRLDYRGKTVTLTCKTDRFQRFTRAKTVDSYQYKADSLFNITSKLLDAEVASRGGPFPLRLIGVRVSGLKDLREPEHGGIKRMFEQVKTSPRKKGKLDHQKEGQHDDFEEAMRRALKLSAQEYREKSSEAGHHEGSLQEDSSVDDVRLDQADTLPPVQDDKISLNDALCPICDRTIDVPINEANASSINALLNAHIDRCLTGQGDGDVVAPAALMPKINSNKPPSGGRSTKKEVANTLDAFFGRQ